MPTLSGTPPLTAEQMAQLRDDSIAMNIVLSGALDGRILELKQIQSDITVKQEALIALDDANTVRAAADKYAATVKAQADDLFDQANRSLADSKNRAAQIESQQKAIDKGMADWKAQIDANAQLQQAAENEFQKKKEQEMAAIKSAQADLSAKESLLAEGNANLAEAQIQLAKDQAEVASLKAQLKSKLDAFEKI